jgi:PKD repeat protein
LTVNFDASASTDSDGTIVLYEWDFDGDGIFDMDTGATSTVSTEYTTAGDYDPAVRVTDDSGDSDTVSLSETVSGGVAPRTPGRPDCQRIRRRRWIGFDARQYGRRTIVETSGT